MEKTELYNVPRNTTIYVKHLEIEYDGKLVKEMEFGHLDGAYSLCYFKDGVAFHLGASTLVYIK